MIANPRKGQRVRVHYAARYAAMMPHHGKGGSVEIVCRGRPRNHGVRLDDGGLVAIPCGNLMPADAAARPSPAGLFEDVHSRRG